MISNILISEMSSKFNEKKDGDEVETAINLNEDQTLKWRGLHHNQYASNKRRTRKSVKNEAEGGDRGEEKEATAAADVKQQQQQQALAAVENSIVVEENAVNTRNLKVSARPGIAKSERVLRRSRMVEEVKEIVPKKQPIVPPTAEKPPPPPPSSSTIVPKPKSSPIKVNRDNSSSSSKDSENGGGEKETEDNSATVVGEETKPIETEQAVVSNEEIKTEDPILEPPPRISKRVTRRLNSTTTLTPKNEPEKSLKKRPEDDLPEEVVVVQKKKKTTESPDSEISVEPQILPPPPLIAVDPLEKAVKMDEVEVKDDPKPDEERKPRLVMKIRTEKDNVSIVHEVPDPESSTSSTSPTSLNPATDENGPKRRGRRPGQTLKGKINEKVKILPKRQIARPEGQQQGLLDKPIEVSAQRLSRRIKPTAKILANDELRHGFEIQNNARLNLTENDAEKEGKLQDAKKGLLSKKSFPEVAKANHHIEITHGVAMPMQVEQLNLDNIYPASTKKPAPDPVEFLNEIKSLKIGVQARSNEEKKLNKKQQRRLSKMKEQHFHKLGLRKTSRSDKQSDSGDDSDENDEFRPPQKISVDKSGVQLRHRSAASKSRAVPNSTLMRQKVLSNPPSRAEIAIKQAVDGSSPRIICLCNQMSEFFSHKSTSSSQNCSAVDQIGQEKIGCCNDIIDEQLNLQRPSARVSFMVLCTSHKNRFYSHHCCPICGVFCTEGRFLLCKRNHLFHRSCVQRCLSKETIKGQVCQCPHCGVEVPGPEVNLYMKCKNELTFYPNQKTYLKSARISLPNGTADQRPRNRKNMLVDVVNLIPDSILNITERYQRSTHRPLESEFTSRDFFYAVNNDDIDRVAEIIASGFDISAPFREFHNGTCLHLIAHFGSLNMLYLILSRAASKDFINAMDKELRTAIMCAVVGEKLEILKVLVQCGADIAMKGPEGMTALHLAAKVGNFDATEVLMEHYKQKVSYQKFEQFVNAGDDGSWTALVWAAEHGHHNIESYLISLGANANICDAENNTVLHWAALSNKLETILPLLDSNCDFNLQNVNGDTALHIAARHANTEICLIFIAHGADITVKNLTYETPLDCVADKASLCARVIRFNLDLKQIPGKIIKRVLSHDISNGRELYPIQVTVSNASEEELLLPDFKYITKAIILQNAIQIDTRVSQMRICACPDNCTSESCQCGEISSQNWYDPNGRLSSEFNYDDPAMIFECNDVCGCHKLLCKNRVVQNGSKVALQIFKCKHLIKGWGAKSVTDIPKGSFVAEYTGEILTDVEADQRIDDSYFFDLGASEHCIDANLYGNVSRFFNHSCNPNVVPIRVYFNHQDLRFPKIAFFAAADIKADEEITFDYGEKFWLVKHKFFMCQCEQPTCRYSAKAITKTLEEYNQRNLPLSIT